MENARCFTCGTEEDDVLYSNEMETSQGRGENWNKAKLDKHYLHYTREQRIVKFRREVCRVNYEV